MPPIAFFGFLWYNRVTISHEVCYAKKTKLYVNVDTDHYAELCRFDPCRQLAFVLADREQERGIDLLRGCSFYGDDSDLCDGSCDSDDGDNF